ncbi:hypothetical protein HPB49_012204 [Dermacentor silvarum]|uniref:Uncharacterized protein n=1 Tax=Dermacentor silvarum TaxID=543639 RepID=A0ACB8C965_DERSI|nr:hypothetical protein HPB49_012204 [Dermacentor silvarum]
MRQILILGKVHELSAHETAPHSTCKGAIRNIPLQDGPDVIDAKIVKTNNPLALAAKRIAQTGTVIVAFDRHRVPNFVSKWTCAKRAAASTCAPLPVTRFAVAVVPLAPMSSISASKECAQRFKIPYIVRRRRSERAKMAGAITADEFQASSTLGAQRRGRFRSRRACSWGRSGSRPHSSSRPEYDKSVWIRSRSRTPTALRSNKPTLSWADMARGGREAPRGDDLRHDSHHANELDELRRVNEQLRKENARVKQEMSRIAAEMADIS